MRSFTLLPEQLYRHAETGQCGAGASPRTVGTSPYVLRPARCHEVRFHASSRRAKTHAPRADGREEGGQDAAPTRSRQVKGEEIVSANVCRVKSARMRFGRLLINQRMLAALVGRAGAGGFC